MSQAKNRPHVNGYQLFILSCAILLVGDRQRAEALDLIGYAPWYSLSGSYLTTTLPQQLPMLDEVRYFGLTVDATGQIVPLAESGTKASHLQRIADLKAAISSLPVAERPRLGITLGGAGEAAAFSTVAGNATLRQTLAQEINSLMTEVSAASVDIDWEHPANDTTELNNYSSLVQRIKQEVGGTRSVYTAMTPERFMPNSAFSGPNAIDGVSLMTYDLGYWGNDPENPNAGEHSLPQYVADAVDAWTDPIGSPIPIDRDWVFTSWGNSTDVANLGVGLPFYGRNISNDEAISYAELKTGGWSTTDGNYYTKAGQTVWIPGLDLVEQRVEYAADAGLANIIIWSLNNDLDPTDPASMLRRAFEANEADAGDYDGDGSVGTSDYLLWRSTFNNSTGDMRADGNENGRIDAADFVFWRMHQTAGMGTGQAIPEPACAAVLLSVAGWLLLGTRCR